MDTIRFSIEEGNTNIAKNFKILGERQFSFLIDEIEFETHFYDCLRNPIEMHISENGKCFGIIKIAFDLDNNTYWECIDNRNVFDFSNHFFPEVSKLYNWNKLNIAAGKKII